MNHKISSVLNIFTKTPVPGTVKTRLIPHLGDDAACDLYLSLLHKTLYTSIATSVDAIHIHCYPKPEEKYFKHYLNDPRISLHQQIGLDLGERMAHAMQNSLRHYDACLIIGCDCPSLQPADIDQALQFLETHQVVIGPAQDGGYYLIGSREYQQGIFHDIEWGTEAVYTQTCEKFKQLNINWQELPEYNDIDSIEDLRKADDIACLRSFQVMMSKCDESCA